MGRRDFLQDVKTVKEYLKGLSNKSSGIIKGFDFSDPELSFRFTYKSGKSVTVRIYVNDTSLSAYPAKFSGLVCVDCADDDPSAGLAAECLKNANNVTENKPLCEVLGTIVKMLCEQFRISVPRDLSISTLKRSCSPLNTGAAAVPFGSSSSWSTNTSKSLAAPPTAQTPATLLHRDLCELRHFGYNAELLCGDQIGFKVAISMPVSRLGLSYEACEAWNLEPDRYLVCTMQFSSSYIDLQGVIANATTTKNYIVKEGGYSAVKESLKKQFPVSFHVCTSSMAKGAPSQAHYKDEETESDHFVLSWTLMKLLSDKFFDMLCDRMWLGIGWAGAEHADMKRNKEMAADYMNSADTVFGGLEEALACDQMQHGVLTYFDGEGVERATESTNRNFLLLVMRFLRRRILLSTRFCLTCHYPHTGSESVSSIRPFVCGSALCEHQALVGLGNLFEAVLVSSPVVVDLLVSLCYVAVGGQNLKPYPSPAIGVTTTTRHDIPNSLVVKWSATQGTIGTKKSSTGYEVYGWKSFDDSVLAGDLLEVYHPDTQQPFSVSRLTQTTTVRVLTVTPGYLVTESPIVVPISVMPHQPVYLPFRVLRRVERNFLRNDGSPDYSLLQTTLDKIPHVAYMVQYAKRGTLKAELDKLDPLCFPLLSWIISSNRTHLRLLDSEEEKVRLADGGAYNNWRQFVMIMSSPEKEEMFQREKDRLQLEKPLLGELYAFHGSPLSNWHSIIRTSLNYNRVAHGRAFGDGVYHSLNAGTSATYAGSMYRNDTSTWKNSMLLVQKCMALCEIINRPTMFTSTHPHLVVRDESWITTRYLFVECLKDQIDNKALEDEYAYNYASNIMPYRPSVPSLPKPYKQRRSAREFLKLDTQYCPIWLNGQPLQIPKRGFSIITHEAPACSSVGVPHFQYDPNAYDIRKDMGDSIKAEPTFDAADVVSDEDDDIESDEDNFMDEEMESADDNYETVGDDMFREEETEHCESDDDDAFDPTLLPLPSESSQFATQRICRELGAIVRKQSRAEENLGFRVDTNRIKSMYQWVVSLIDFDPSLPLARDMARHRVQSIDLEVRFAPDYPYSPPYIRVIRPRLLRFMNGGGGHVTAGGSICMDLLTTSGWSSVYTMEAVLLQIKMALSSTEPHPARLDTHWNTEYSPMEAIDSFIRVANTHGWGIPPQWRQLFGH